MQDDLYTGLKWLPPCPDDFGAQVKAATHGDVPAGPALRSLAQHALSELELNKLSRALGRVRTENRDLDPLAPLKIGLLSNSTTEFIAPCVEATAMRYGFAPALSVAPFGQVVQEAINPASDLYAHEPDFILVLLDYRGLPLQCEPGDREGAKVAVDLALQEIANIQHAIETNSRAIGVFQTLARPAEPTFGSLDLAVPGTWRNLTSSFNQSLADHLADTRHVLLDTAGLAETVGLAHWHDPKLWNMAKIPFSNAMLPLYADHIMRVIASARGKSRRCLVLDLDNTLWGGVIGDDGMSGIRLAEGDPTGEAHRFVQRYALDMRNRGIVLAVSSKNDDAVAREVFRDHAEMLMREEHVAVFQANWQDKATNIRAISDEIALGLESIAFLDDNPAERGLVRENLPLVAIPELTDDPAYFVRTLAASGVFEAVTFSAEDLKRAEDYQSNAKRAALKASATDLDGYLRSLEMEYTFRAFDSQGRARITQLINKSNQFNLTTRRYSEADVAALEDDPAVFTMQVRLKDRFADNGMICVVICRQSMDTWTIDTWLMSCRVLGRRVEQCVMNVLKSEASSRGIQFIRGEYRPTERNSMVKDHYEKLGFTKVTGSSEETFVWEIPVGDVKAGETVGHVDVVFP